MRCCPRRYCWRGLQLLFGSCAERRTVHEVRKAQPPMSVANFLRKFRPTECPLTWGRPLLMVPATRCWFPIRSTMASLAHRDE